MKIVFDFISGKIGLKEFQTQWYGNPEIGQWVDRLIDLKSPLSDEWEKLPYPEVRMLIHNHYSGSVRCFIEATEKRYSTQPRNRVIREVWFYRAIAAVVLVAYPQTVFTKFYDDEEDYYMDTPGDYLGGIEVDGFIYEILMQYPRTLGKRTRKKNAKAHLQKAFHIQLNKYPRWIQEPEWPMGTCSPMQYLSTKRQGERVQFIFQDVDTKDIRIVEQYY